MSVGVLLAVLCLFSTTGVPSLAQPATLSSFNISISPWRPTQNRIILSPNSVFAAGFKPLNNNNSNLFVFSVWYYQIPGETVVWSANIGSPANSSAALYITSTGELLLDDGSGSNLWPTNTSGSSNSTALILSNNGSLVYGDWQSFQIPSNTILPNQSIAKTQIVSNNRKFALVNSTSLIFNSSYNYWRASSPLQNFSETGKLTLVDGNSFITSDFGDRPLRRLVLDDDGNLRIYSFDVNATRWNMVWEAITELCTIQGTCGPNSICMDDGYTSTYCVCPPGFIPVSGGPQQGCVIKAPLSQTTKFLRLDYVNFTGGPVERAQDFVNFTSCEASCLAKPNCHGFIFKFSGNGYCELRLDGLLFGYWSPGTQAAMFLRVDKAETDQSNFTGLTYLLNTTCPVQISLPFPPEESSTTTRNIAIICTLFAAELISGALFFWAFLKKFIKYRDMARTLGFESFPAGGPKRFTYAELRAATNDFSNLIGKGGFGDVFKGELPDKRVVAVKCLKHVSGGDAEFWAEVTIIARMHHLNLVRLWGFCAEKGQRMLVYEYVPNGSLDKFLFRPGKSDSEPSKTDVEASPVDNNRRQTMPDWNVRYRIALGVARAIAYLHEECLEWVLHCDIKPENILLGDDFCPKISDFGLAKLRKKEDMVSMSRIRGTRGYMAPEWVKMDPITPKADVYSFGMVLLEMVSGVRSFEVQASKTMDSEDWYFPRWAFEKVFKEMNVEDILDQRIKHSYDSRAHFDQVNRMVQTAIWCLQDRPEIRPSMGKVAKMLEGTVEITEPRKPTIFFLSD